MIKLSDLPTLLKFLNFNNTENIWTKTFPNHAQLQVDFDKQRLIYPENLGMVINGRQTCNFDNPENFVVFECVHRLLEKGYQPRHIELEKLWSLGHTQKSGRADICVFSDDEKNRMLFIIECKTYGREYTNALKVLQEDGGQLFSYWQQDRSTEWIALYASDFIDNKIIYKNDIIHCRDDNNLIEVAKTDTTIRLYRNAHTKENLHQIWQETYIGNLHDNLLFGEDTTAYQIGLRPLRKKDLKDFAPDDKIINQFEEILRHNAVSDKENAFNRLIALFICKLVDETNTDDHDEVKFQYKVGQDTYESLQDRLQQLYKEGMDKFMKEEIFYVPNGYAQAIFETYQGGDRKHAINELEATIRKLKFYTNNDFAFKDVHNEALFLQNGKILVEMVQLFEKYRIVYPSKHQFLGDLFEQLLNKGFKQNEGQFFTPSPITRFIWDSLPLQQRLSNQDDFPKVIDYACGSGHFLTEAVEAINAVKRPTNNDWVKEHIFGLEKDYRLARVSQVSMFMNGAGDSNIIFGDGLDNHDLVNNEQFDILVANPPYSVSAFKSHLKLTHNQLNLLNVISNNGGEIEVLFCERIAQLLKSGGIGAVILPISILSNDSRSYTEARSLILSEFLIRAIVTLGNKTFGATGTHTVILFLEKMNYPPKAINFAQDCAEAIFRKIDLSQWNDKVVYEAYLRQIDVPMDLYDKLRLQQLSWQELQAIDNEYVSLHRSALVAKVSFSKTQMTTLSEDEKNALRLKAFFEGFATLEQEKLVYFYLTYRQTTLIVNAPSDNAKQKEFLGYDWSNRKGAEGIQIIKAGGKLYDENDRFAPNTLASYVRGMFEQEYATIADEHKEYAFRVNTVDMIDFSLVNFNKVIRTSAQKKVEIVSKYPLVKLGEKVKVLIGGTPSRSEQKYFKGQNLWVSISEMKGSIITDTKEKITDLGVEKSNVKLIPKGTTLLSFKLSIGKTAITGCELYTNEAIAGLIPFDKNEILDLYLFHFFNSKMIDLENIGNKAFGKSLNSTYLKEEIKIPLPPLEIQQKIIDECQKVDDEYQNQQILIQSYRNDIENLVANIHGKPTQLSEVTIKIGSGATPKGGEASYKQTGIPLIRSQNVYDSKFHYEGLAYIDEEQAKKLDNVTVEKNDVLFNITGASIARSCIVPNELVPARVNQHVAIIRPNQQLLAKYLQNVLTSDFYKSILLNIGKVGGLSREAITKTELENFKIPLIPIEQQENIVKQIEAIEAKIAQAETTITQTMAKKQAILQKYL